MTTGILITMVSCAVIAAVGEEVSVVLQKPEFAKWIKVGAISLEATLGLSLVATLINKTKQAFGG